MSSYRFTRPPRRLSRRGVKLDNLALVPASLLPFKEHWQQIANRMPTGSVLVFLPQQEKQSRIARFVASNLREKGKSVAVVTESAEKLFHDKRQPSGL